MGPQRATLGDTNVKPESEEDANDLSKVVTKDNATNFWRPARGPGGNRRATGRAAEGDARNDSGGQNDKYRDGRLTEMTTHT